MSRALTFCSLGAALLVLTGCVAYVGAGCCPGPCASTCTVARSTSGGPWSLSDARMAEKIEMQLDHAGNRGELEFHIAPSAVPEVVRKAMDELHPGGPYTGAEKEWEGGALYYELTREVDGLEVEAMFTPGGALHSEEIEIAEAAVPEAVRAAVAGAYAGGQVKKWEEIRDGQRKLVEYHVKLVDGGRKLKVIVTTSGTVTGAFLEILAEIEIPAPPVK